MLQIVAVLPMHAYTVLKHKEAHSFLCCYEINYFNFKFKDFSCKKKVQILCKTQVSTTTVFRPFIKLCFFSLCRLLCSKDFISMTTIHFWSSVGLHRSLWRLMWQTLSFKSVLTYYCNHLIGWCFWCLQRSIRCSLSPIKHSTFLSVFKSQMAKQMSDCFCPFLLWPKYKQTAEPLK